jgi:hypothetical protein
MINYLEILEDGWGGEVNYIDYVFLIGCSPPHPTPLHSHKHDTWGWHFEPVPPLGSETKSPVETIYLN